MSDVPDSSFYLPEHLIFKILLRLPLKSILVCTSVCKTWNSFIKSPSFISSHLNRTIDGTRRLYLLHTRSPGPIHWLSFTFSVHSDHEKKLSKYLPLHFPYKDRCYAFKVISSCNGLVLLMNASLYKLNLIFWNPVIRKSVIIAKEKNCNHLEAAGLGLDSKTGDYKVLMIILEKDKLKVELYCCGLVYRDYSYALLSICSYGGDPSSMISHDLRTKESNFGYFDGKSICYFFGDYVESLVLIDKGDDLSVVFETDSCKANDASFGSSSGNAEGVSKRVYACVDSSHEESSSGAASQGRIHPSLAKKQGRRQCTRCSRR